MEIGRDEMYIARLNPRMGTCTLSRSLSSRPEPVEGSAKGKPKHGRFDKPFRQAQRTQRPRFGRFFDCAQNDRAANHHHSRNALVIRAPTLSC